MTTTDQKKFIKSLCNSIRDELCRKTVSMPVSWNGHQLREIIADKFDYERTLKRCYGARSAMLKDYRSSVYNSNL